MPTLLESLLFDPDCYLAAIDGDHFAFRSMSRDHYARSIFLDHRIVARDDVTTRAPIDPLLSGARQLRATTRPIRFIFHVAHCGSTLLARALERSRGDLVLREPAALRQLGVLAASAAPAPPPREWEVLAYLVYRLLAKQYDAGAPVIVKANVPVNFMVPWLLARHRDTPALFLYLPFEDYLLAVLRSDDHRSWVLQVTSDLFPALEGIAEIGDLLDPAKMAAALWLAQMRIYADALERFPATRSLDANVLFAEPQPVVAAAAQLFGTPLSPDEIGALMAGPLFATYSKDASVSYDVADRSRERDEAAARLAGEIAAARVWLTPKLAGLPLPDALPRPLVGGPRPLF